MLTALTKEGKMFNLAGIRNTQLLQNLKKEAIFFCPVCSAQVILKVGRQKIPHFSHQKSSDCTFATEPESIRHMQGKKDLYLWLLKQKLIVYLEKYLSKIKQRPDILVKKNGKWFAVEYQCSPLPLKSIEERTTGYISCNIQPIWILGGYPYQREKGEFFHLSDFQWSFTQANEKNGLSLMSYSPEDQYFHFLSNISSFSSRKVKALYNKKSLAHSSFPIQLPNLFHHDKQIDDIWFESKRKWVEKKLMYGKAFLDPFLHTMYECNLHPLLLPPIIGIPVDYIGVCKTHPSVWQFYVWYDSLRLLKLGDKITYNHIQKGIEKRASLHHIEFRILPFVSLTYRKRMIYVYLQTLVRYSYLREVRKGIFILNKTITFPKNMEEVIVLEKEFKKRLNLL